MFMLILWHFKVLQKIIFRTVLFKKFGFQQFYITQCTLYTAGLWRVAAACRTTSSWNIDSFWNTHLPVRVFSQYSYSSVLQEIKCWYFDNSCSDSVISENIKRKFYHHVWIFSFNLETELRRNVHNINYSLFTEK